MDLQSLLEAVRVLDSVVHSKISENVLSYRHQGAIRILDFLYDYDLFLSSRSLGRLLCAPGSDVYIFSVLAQCHCLEVEYIARVH